MTVQLSWAMSCFFPLDKHFVTLENTAKIHSCTNLTEPEALEDTQPVGFLTIQNTSVTYAFPGAIALFFLVMVDMTMRTKAALGCYSRHWHGANLCLCTPPTDACRPYLFFTDEEIELQPGCS